MSKPILARKLHFKTLDDIVAEAKRIAQSDDAVSRGTWTPAQNIWHVGRFVKACVEGYPMRVPIVLKLIGPLLKNRTLTKGFSPGIRLPRNAAEHMVAPAHTTIEQAMDMLETSVQNVKEQGFMSHNPILGSMTPQQWVDLHCRHAEMHFGLIELPDE
jgi:hypothetical protein